MPTPETSTSSLLRDLAGLSLSPRKGRSRIDSIKEPDFSSRFGQWMSLTKRQPKEAKRHRSPAREIKDADSLAQDLHREKKRLRRALKELAELRRDRDELDEQRHKTTTDLKRLRERHHKSTDKLAEYRLRLQDQDRTLDRERANAQILRQEVEEKDEEIDQLTKDWAKAKSRLQRNRDKLDRERAEVSRLNTCLSDVKTQRYPSSENQDALASLRILRTSHEELKREYATSLEDQKALKTESASLEEDCSRLRSDRDAARKTLVVVKAQNASQTQSIAALLKTISDLEKTRDLIQPVLQIGVDIRLRNLETAREILLKIKQGEKDRAILLSGNVAAHRANGAVDAALFMAGLVPEDYLPQASRVFEKLYQVSPEDYGCWSPMVLRMIDCQATIATIQVQHHFKKFDTTHLRNEHDRLHGFLTSRHKKLSPGEFEGDPKAKELLARIEDIMEEIVDLSRGKGKGRKTFEPFEYLESEDEELQLKAKKSNQGSAVKYEEDDSPEEDHTSQDDTTETDQDTSQAFESESESESENGSDSEE
ncbi:hypothetical protein VTL71DRAFT_8636 [Oculimacula yallundae]|uniref:Uncharacterized protein n=1 Tax=Oculimacula yallundae TaxID=86028 RepID=A0ABR4CYB2_9HELO